MIKRKRRNYSNEFKVEAVKLVTDQGYPVAEAARNLGVNANLLGRWKKESEQPENESTLPGSMVAMQMVLYLVSQFQNLLFQMDQEQAK